MKSRRPTRGWRACLAAVLLTACCGTERAYFRPTDNLVEVPGRGYLAIASYPLQDAQGRPIGQVRLDSQGVFEAEFNHADGRQTVLGIKLTVTNTSKAPFVLPPGEQTVDNLDGVPKLFPYLVYVDGVLSQQIEVPPDAARQIDLLYRIPPRTDVSRIEDFLFHWHLQVDSEEKVEFTHFVRMPPTSYYFPAYAYSGYWNGYFFPGYFAIPEWGMGIYFAPPIFPYYEEPPHGVPVEPHPGRPPDGHDHHPPPAQQPATRPPAGSPPAATPPAAQPPPAANPPAAQPPAATPPAAQPPPAANPPAEKPPAATPPAAQPPPAANPPAEKPPAAQPPPAANPPAEKPPAATPPAAQPPPAANPPAGKPPAAANPPATVPGADEE